MSRLKLVGSDGGEAQPPVNLEAEQGLLGEILMGNEAVYYQVAEYLRPGHFFEPLHQRIFAVAGEMLLAGKACTVVTISAYLPAEMPIVQGFTLQAYLARLAAEAIGATAAPGFARTIHDLAAKRAALAACEDAAFELRRVDEKSRPTRAVVADVQADLFHVSTEIEDAAGRRHDRGFAGIIKDAEQRRLDAADGKSQFKGVASSLVALDHKLGGLAPGDLCILGGRPSMGKTAVAVTWSRRAAHRDHGVLFLGYEQGNDAVRSRFLSDHCEFAGTRIPFSAIDRRVIREGDKAALERAAETLQSYPLLFVDRARKLADIVGHVRWGRRELAKRGKKLELVVLDQMSSVDVTGGREGDRVGEMTAVSRGLKGIALDEEVAFLALHQLSRSVEHRRDHRPILSDLRESGAIEQDADQVIFVFRPAYYLEQGRSELEGGIEAAVERDAARANVARHLELIIAKNRQGPVGVAELDIDLETNSVRDRAWRSS